MGVFVDIFYEIGMVFRDITLYCDKCGKEDYFTTSAFDSRRMAKKDGWLRKYNKQKGRYEDICPKCKKE